jgi:hypothetical protein
LLETGENYYRTTTETSETLKVTFGEQTAGRTHVFDWFSKFRSCMTSAEDAEHLELTSTSKTGESVERLKEVVLKNRRMTLYEVANVFGTSFVPVSSGMESVLILILIYLSTAVRLTPGGSTHLHTNSTQNITINNKTTCITNKQTNNTNNMCFQLPPDLCPAC